MSAEVLLASAASVVSVYAALFHGWVYWQHRSARDHLWVAITAAGAAAVCAGGAHLYASTAPEAAVLGARLQIAGAAVVTAGVLRFATHRFRVDAPRLARSVEVFAAGVLLLDALAPELLLELGRGPRPVATLGLAFLHFDLTPLAQALLALAFAYFFAAVLFAVRALHRGEPGARPLVAALGVWTVAALSDGAVGLGLYDFPLLMATGGYPVVVVTLSAVLMRELIIASDDVEHFGDQLHALARERADALRVVEIQLARGEPLAAIGTLAAGVAHEINSPLAWVSARLNHLHELWEQKDAEGGEFDELLAECREGLARVRTIANDLLRMARHGASESEALDLSEVIRAVLPVVEREVSLHARIEARLAPDLPLRGSARLLGQVALNLIWNAVHASGGRGDVARIEVATHPSRDGVELVVSDDGPALPRQVLERIFEPTFTTRPDGRGGEIGLALVRLIVSHHGGEIRAESSEAGTTITVWLPAAATRPSALGAGGVEG